jgi:hypothetical protein
MLNQVLSFLGKKKRTWTMDWNWTEMEFACYLIVKIPSPIINT